MAEMSHIKQVKGIPLFRKEKGKQFHLLMILSFLVIWLHYRKKNARVAARSRFNSR